MLPLRSNGPTWMGNCHCRKTRTKIGSRPSAIGVDLTDYVNMSPEKDIVKLKKIRIVATESYPRRPSQDSDAGSGYSICETMYNIDPAWDTDAASCFGSISPSLYSVSSFGSFSGPGCFSESSSSYTVSDTVSDIGSMISGTVSDVGSVVSHFPRVGTE